MIYCQSIIPQHVSSVFTPIFRRVDCLPLPMLSCPRYGCYGSGESGGEMCALCRGCCLTDIAEDFFGLKNSTASAGFEPANLGTKGQHATSRPPKPLEHKIYYEYFITKCLNTMSVKLKVFCVHTDYTHKYEYFTLSHTSYEERQRSDAAYPESPYSIHN